VSPIEVCAVKKKFYISYRSDHWYLRTV